MWAAATGGPRSNVVLQWLAGAMQVPGIRSREGLAEWVHAQGFSQPRWGARERLLNAAAASLDSGSQKTHTRSRTGGGRNHLHHLNVVGRRRTQSIGKMFSRSGSEFCRVVLTNSRVPQRFPSGIARTARCNRSRLSEADPSVESVHTASIHVARKRGEGRVVRQMLCARFEKFGAGQLAEILGEAQHSVASSHNR